MPATPGHSSSGSRLPEAERGGDLFGPRCHAAEVGQAPRDYKGIKVADVQQSGRRGGLMGLDARDYMPGIGKNSRTSMLPPWVLCG